MKWLALLLIGVAVFDVSMSMAKLIPERNTLKKAWLHNKKEFIPLIYSTICSVLAIVIFIDYIRRY